MAETGNPEGQKTKPILQRPENRDIADLADENAKERATDVLELQGNEGIAALAGKYTEKTKLEDIVPKDKLPKFVKPKAGN